MAVAGSSQVKNKPLTLGVEHKHSPILVLLEHNQLAHVQALHWRVRVIGGEAAVEETPPLPRNSSCSKLAHLLHPCTTKLPRSWTQAPKGWRGFWSILAWRHHRGPWSTQTPWHSAPWHSVLTHRSGGGGDDGEGVQAAAGPQILNVMAQIHIIMGLFPRNIYSRSKR